MPANTRPERGGSRRREIHAQEAEEPAQGGLFQCSIYLLSAGDVAFIAVIGVVPFLSAAFGFVMELPCVVAER
jgi:hypothetical protein